MIAAEIRNRFREFSGEEKFKRFVRALNIASIDDNRLRFWQEKLWTDFAKTCPQCPSDYSELRLLFQICEVHGDELISDSVLAPSQSMPRTQTESPDSGLNNRTMNNEVYPYPGWGVSPSQYTDHHYVNVLYCPECRRLRTNVEAKRRIVEAQIVEQILDCDDGSCRDVTFKPCTKTAVAKFLKLMLIQYDAIESAFDANGIDQATQLRTGDPLSSFDGSLHIILKGENLIRNLQLFILQDGELFCVEATFFPDDIDRQRFSFLAFSDMIESWNTTLRADDYFVRYENASWELYDPNGLGIIYSRRKPPEGWSIK